MDMITLALAKNYTNSQRLGYTEAAEVEIFKATLGFVMNADVGLIFSPVDPITFVSGKTYKVIWDGVRYDVLPDENGNLGNKGLAGEEDTGEPFLYVNGAFVAATEGTHTVTITADGEITHKIDPEFIPQVDAYEKIDLYKEYGCDTAGSINSGNVISMGKKLRERVEGILSRGKIPAIIIRTYYYGPTPADIHDVMLIPSISYDVYGRASTMSAFTMTHRDGPTIRTTLEFSMFETSFSIYIYKEDLGT